MVSDVERLSNKDMNHMNLKYIGMVALMCGAMACDDQLEVFETVGEVKAPVALEASEIHTESLPGKIRLYWDVTEDPGFEYVKVKYYDPWEKQTVHKLASKYTGELSIENTYARFGDYAFSFQTFNAANEGSAVTEVKAQSGPAPIVLTETKRTKVNVEASQLSTDNQEPSEGPIKNLVDNNKSTMFHTRWSTPQVPLPQYIQIDFKEEHQIFAIQYTTRDTGNKDGFPTAADLQISTDGEHWETVTSLSGLPATKLTDYSSAFVDAGKKFKYFRFLVTSSSENKPYFHMAEFAFYDVEVETYDPETVPLN